MRNKLVILLSIFLFSLSFTTYGQKQVNSPYSRFNIGSLDPAGSFRSQAMGGVGVGIRDNTSIIFSNPASYSCIDTMSFIFDFGLDYSKNHLVEGTESYHSDDMNFDHLLMGFPVKKGWGVAIGLVPVSNGFYNITESVLETDPDFNPVVGEYTLYHSGDGSLSNFFIGTGIQLNKHFSAGVNMTVLFGQLRRTNQFDFSDYYNVFNNNTTEKLQLGGVNLDYGLQYTLPLKDKKYFNAGISFTPGRHYNTNYEHILFRYTAYSTTDTISYLSVSGKSTFIPGTFKAGISYGKTDKFTAGLDFIATAWSKAKIPGTDGTAADTKSLIFGAELIPDKYSNYSFMKRLEYRIGAHAGNNYLKISNEQIKEAGVSFGLGIPMRRSTSRTNVYFDFTRKTGSLVNNLHNENYFTVGISLNLHDRWFEKRKYD